MRIYIDNDTAQIVTDSAFKAPVGNVAFKRGDASTVEVVFVSGNTPDTADEERSEHAAR